MQSVKQCTYNGTHNKPLSQRKRTLNKLNYVSVTAHIYINNIRQTKTRVNFTNYDWNWYKFQYKHTNKFNTLQ